MTSANIINRSHGRSNLNVAAGFASLFLAAPMPGLAVGPGTIYKDQEFGYSVTAPSGWKRKADFPRPYVAFLGPVEDGFQTNFHVDPEPAGNKTLAQFVKVARETAAKNKAIRLRGERRATLAGSPAVIMQSVVTLEGQPPTISHQVVALHGGRGYTITFTVAPSALKKNLPTFAKVISSFHWQR